LRREQDGGVPPGGRGPVRGAGGGRGLAMRRLMISTTGLVLLLGGCRGSISESPPVHWNQNMDQQNRFEAQEENPFFGDKRAMRPHVEGTVPRGALHEDDHLWRGMKDGAFAT